MLSVWILISFLLFGNTLGDTDHLLCTEEFCTENECEMGECDNGYSLPSPTACNCCEFCLPYFKENEECDSSGNKEGSVCGPRQTCDGKKCTPMSESSNMTECISKQKDYDTSGFGWKPQCDDDGNFVPVHCIQNSICYCIDPTSGERIFGESLYEEVNVNEKDLCSCSVAAWKAAKLGKDTEFFHCLANGLYDPLQCINECSCVDSKTGTPDGSEKVIVTDLEEGALDCFDPEEHSPKKFEKVCEEERDAKLYEIRTDQKNGLYVINEVVPTCTIDGRYSRVQKTEEGGIVCVDPNGKQIESFQSDKADSDCNCARTRWLMRQAKKSVLPECNKDGSFRPWQCWMENCYCVDCNGNQVTDEVDLTSQSNLMCYNSALSCTSAPYTSSL